MKSKLIAVLLIALVTIGAILLGLLIVCVVLTCLKRSSQRACSSGTGFLRYCSPTHTLDKRAMIQDSSSEGSAADPGPVSYLTPTHQVSTISYLLEHKTHYGKSHVFNTQSHRYETK
jgi:hypothetical protein